MTSGNNGASAPEDDDPFGYLYADGQANGAQPPSGGGYGYGYPNSVNRTRSVGQRQYGQQQAPAAPNGPYGQVPQQQGQNGYTQPSAHYAAPETFPGGAPTSQQAMPGYSGGGGRGGGPNTKGLLIGAIAVVAAVVIGIGIAMAGGDDNDKAGDSGASTTPSTSQSSEPSASSSSGSAASEEYKKTIDAKALRLGGGAALASDVEGAQSDGGIYVGNLNNVGASVTWTVNGIPSDGTYTLFAHYSTAGEDQSMTLTVNGKVFGTKLGVENYAHAKDGDFAKGWTTTYSWPTLTKGTNTISISCGDGDKCNVLLDQVWLKKGQVKS
ncbi:MULTISPECIES: carbohydrate-binding protein [Streptomyces]|uniref:Carbohydrate-binding protein n=1 Tax=Streptomyces doebereineriae TaxID=3075528 RepID=A0ABU2VHL6_9ACTN|nr:carbohydrate-binding protein [Streptomyces sp. DSM 41640]MDT0485081.1 carbohydrate-binding protein [Streptomyces sp. DSM 41640]